MMAQQSPNGKLTVEPRQQKLVVSYQQQPVIEVETGIETAALRKSKDAARWWCASTTTASPCATSTRD